MWLSKAQLGKIGFKRVGKNVLISDKAVFYNPQNISIGNSTRIDDFCLLSAGKEITIGSYVHIGCNSVLLGHGLIQLDDFSGLSLNCVVLSSSDDYSGEYLTNPMISEDFRNTKHAPVVLGKHALVGAGSIVMPGVSMGIGAVAGALSFVKQSIPEFQIWAGNPLKYIKPRYNDLLKLEKLLKHG